MRDFKVYLQDIVAACESIDTFTAGMDLDNFRNDDKTASAVIRKLEIIGEQGGTLFLSLLSILQAPFPLLAASCPAGPSREPGRFFGVKVSPSFRRPAAAL